MTKKVFIWVGHPKSGSLCEGLADAYEEAARAAGLEVRRQDLSAMRFSADGFAGYGPDAPAFEPDLERWRENLAWADHLLVVHPYWWAGLPAQMKSVLDRGLTSGFAYKYKARGAAWDKLLTGRTADVIITSDTPPLIDRLLYGRPGRRVWRNQILGFCGIKPRKIIQLGSVKLADEAKRLGWIDQAGRLGASLAA